MRLYHVTFVRSLNSILRDRYLDPMRARGKRKVVWLVPARLVSWAIGHVQMRHCCSLSSIRILDFGAATPACSEHAGSDKWFTPDRVPIHHASIMTAAEWLAEDDTCDSAGALEGLINAG